MPDLAQRAGTAAIRAAAAAGIVVREVHDLADLAAMRRLFDTLWSADPTNPVATVELLRAYAHTGQYVVLADDLTRPGRPPVAASVGFLAAPAGRVLYSNVTGVLPPGRGRSLGFALKLHQRAWALDRGLAEITWTFDPLIRRNAWFNLAKLGARVRDYVANFYGAMADGVNLGDISDRLYLAWPLACPDVERAAEGRPLGLELAALRASGAEEVLVAGAGGGPRVHGLPGDPAARLALAEVPADVETLRRADPPLAAAWRAALRDVLSPALSGGWRVAGFAREGFYVLQREEEA